MKKSSGNSCDGGGWTVFLVCCCLGLILIGTEYAGVSGQQEMCLPSYCPLIPTLCDVSFDSACDDVNDQNIMQQATLEAKSAIMNLSLQLGVCQTSSIFSSLPSLFSLL